MIRIKAPERTKFESFPKLFLAGSIEMGAAKKWQDRVAEDLKDGRVLIFDPRRDDWDSSWVQDPVPGTQFYEQVTWELEHIDKADLVCFYFDSNTQSPITLLELGTCLGAGYDVVVYCPEDYFRYGNVALTCEHYGVDLHTEYETFIDELKIFVSGEQVR